MRRCKTNIYGCAIVTFGLTASSGLLQSSALADGIDGNGVGAQSMGMGGADVAWALDPLSSMGLNPSGIAFVDGAQLSLGGIGGFATGDFRKPGISGTLTHSGAALPEGAFALPLGKWPISLGLSFVPESTSLANWHYFDPPGGANGTNTYGYQQDKSEIVVLRSALGVAAHFGSKFSIGASGGMIYNQNVLVTPYIFQHLTPAPGAPSNSGDDGAKTLLNLRTSGFGANAQAGMLYKPTEDLQFGLAYESQTRVDTGGTATGDPYAQFGVKPGPLAFSYKADVQNIFPQNVSWGLSWKFHPQWRLALQADWIDWANAFHNLPVVLSEGNNKTVNSVLGTSFADHIPLDWKNELVYRGGIEYYATKRLIFRAGYSYGGSPVPDSTLTPTTAAIMENTVSVGAGYVWERYHFDFAYQYSLPAIQYISTSGLRSGEYSGSSTIVSTHVFALTVGVHF